MQVDLQQVQQLSAAQLDLLPPSIKSLSLALCVNMDGKCLKSLMAIVALMIFLVAAPPIQVDGLFVWLISHQPAVLFSQNKPATNNQPAVIFSQNKPAPAISHQPTEQACCPNVAARACYAPCTPFLIKETCAILCDCLIRDKGQCPPDHRW
jgi:hypothetical protein